MNIKSYLQKLFCNHQYVKIGFRDEYENGLRYSVRKYKCSKCGKEIWIDGRYDKYSK